MYGKCGAGAVVPYNTVTIRDLGEIEGFRGLSGALLSTLSPLYLIKKFIRSSRGLEGALEALKTVIITFLGWFGVRLWLSLFYVMARVRVRNRRHFVCDKGICAAF